MTMEIEAGVHAEGGAGCRRRCRLPVAAVDQLGGLGADRRRAGDQCRRQQHGALRQRPRPRARPRSRVARRAGVERAAAAAQGQYRLLPAPAVRRQRGHARHHHRRGAEALSAAARDRGGAVRGRLARGGARPVQPAAAARPGGDPGLRIHVGSRGRAGAAAHSRARRCRCATPAPAYVLVELATPREGAGLRGSLEAVLGGGDGGGRSSPTR